MLRLAKHKVDQRDSRSDMTTGTLAKRKESRKMTAEIGAPAHVSQDPCFGGVDDQGNLSLLGGEATWPHSGKVGEGLHREGLSFGKFSARRDIVFP